MMRRVGKNGDRITATTAAMAKNAEDSSDERPVAENKSVGATRK